MKHAESLENIRFAESALKLAELQFVEQRENQCSPIDQIFGGQMAEALLCQSCTKVSVTSQPFSILTLPLANTRSDTGLTHLQDCLQAFTHVETINGLQCDCCNPTADNTTNPPKKRTAGQRRSLISQLPSCLCIQLMRFRYLPHMQAVYKLKSPVNIPLNGLHMRDVVINDEQAEGSPSKRPSQCLYDLQGFIIHRGSSDASEGHYLSYSKVSNDIWYCFNDEKVYEVNIQKELARKVVQENLYILFYKREACEIM